MEHQLPLHSDLRADSASAEDDGTHQIAPDIAFQMHLFVNTAVVGTPHVGDRQWVLIDAGIIGYAGTIEKAAAARFGPDARPPAS